MTTIVTPGGQGEHGYYTVDFNALAQIIPSLCCTAGEVDYIVGFLRSIGFDSTIEAADIAAEDLRVAINITDTSIPGDSPTTGASAPLATERENDMDTTTEELSMEQHARQLRDDLTNTLERLARLDALGDRAEDAAEALREELNERPYGIYAKIVVNVELYGGGPAGGVVFECEQGDHGLEWLTARCWHQDWFQPKGWATLDHEVADSLFDQWGIAYHGPNGGC